MKSSFLFAASTAVLLAAAASALAADYALVVGVNECPGYIYDKQKPKVLEGAEDDAEAFRGLLQNTYHIPAANIVQLIGKKATHEAVQKNFADLGQRLSADDRLVFYFAGHGTQVPDAPPYPPPYDEVDDHLDEALCPSDASVKDDLAKNVVVDDELADWLSQIHASRITVVLDCCHAGTAIKDAQPKKIQERSLPTVELPKRPLTPNSKKQPWWAIKSGVKGGSKSVVALYACGPGQSAIERSFDDLKAPHDVRGQFTKLLIDSLRQHPTASPIAISGQLKNRIQQLVDADIAIARAAGPLPKAWQSARDQNPSFEATDGGKGSLIAAHQ